MNIENIKNRLKPIIYPIINFVPRRRLRNKEFTREPLKTSVEHLERQIYLSSTVYFL